MGDVTDVHVVDLERETHLVGLDNNVQSCDIKEIQS